MTKKLTDADKGFLALLQRSHDLGFGWRQASELIWEKVVERFPHPELLEKDAQTRMVRLSERGEIVMEYLG